ncbi:MAG: methyltransferase domain-containing protein [Planctomycetota bacterium]|nr:methyltransferase domain-containing protein [Planctomycetota bacterium]
MDGDEHRILQPGEIEYEHGVAIPGVIKPPAEWARTALKHLPDGPLDFQAVFGRSAPVVVELGCGNGRYTLMSALARPDHDHLGTDILAAAIRYATRRANQRGLHNVRFAVKDAETLLRRYVAPGSVAEVHVYHPQPYHDPREAGRRLITPRFLADVHRALRPGGLFVVQTDSAEYWAYMQRVMPAFFHFVEQHGPWPDAPEGRSRREIVARGRGMPVYRGSGTRRDELTAEAIAALVKELPRPTFHTRPAGRRRSQVRREDGPGSQ